MPVPREAWVAAAVLSTLAIAGGLLLVLSRASPPTASTARREPAAETLHGTSEIRKAGGASIVRGTEPDSEPSPVEGGERVSLSLVGRVSGKVVAPSGDPISEATIEGRKESPGEGTPVHRTAQADEGGSFRIEGLEPGAWRLRASAPDHLPSPWTEVGVEAGVEGEEVVFTLEEGLAVEGWVRDEVGAPLPGARVVGLAPAEASELQGVETSQQGHFRISPLPLGEVVLEASLDGFLPTRTEGVRAGDSGVEIVLRAVAAIRGRVVDDGGSPVPAFRVEAKRDLGTYAVESPRVASFEDGEGRFLLAGLVPGLYDLRASAQGDGAAGTVEGVRAAAGETAEEVLVRLHRAGSIFGFVRGEEGAPIDGATVGIVSEMSAGELGQNWFERRGDLAVRTGAGGAFEFARVRPGVHTLFARAPGRGSGALEEVEVAAGEAAGPVTILLRRGGTIEGSVTEVSGEAVSGVAIVVLSEQDVGAPRNSRWLHARTDEAGTYRVEDVLPGSYMVVRVVEEPGAEAKPAEMRSAHVRSGETTVVDFTQATSGAQLAGTVYGAGGAPLPNRQVVVVDFSRTGSTIESAFSKPDGSYRIAGLRGGFYGIYVTRGISLNSVFLETVSIPSRPIEVRRDLTLPGGAIAGRVRDARTGSPLPRARLALLADIGVGPAFIAGTGVADEEGAFRFEDVSRRHYRVSATADGYGQETSERFFLDEDEVREGIELSLHPGGSLALRVLDGAGRPVPRAFVTFRDPAGNTVPIGAPMPWTGADGTLRAEGVKPGRYTAAAVKEGAPLAVGLVEVREGERTEATLQGFAPGVAVEAPSIPAPR